MVEKIFIPPPFDNFRAIMLMLRYLKTQFFWVSVDYAVFFFSYPIIGVENAFFVARSMAITGAYFSHRQNFSVLSKTSNQSFPKYLGVVFLLTVGGSHIVSYLSYTFSQPLAKILTDVSLFLLGYFLVKKFVFR